MSKLTILDGGMSRELIRLGAELKQPEWSALALIDSPAVVQRVHEEFIEAGADVVTTNSYALVPFHIGEERFKREGAELVALSGRLARSAADKYPQRNVRVAASLPPIFGSYEPELFRPDDVQRYLKVFVDNLHPHVDIWLGETLSLIAEGEAVRVATAETAKPFWISFTLADDDEALREGVPKLRGGETVREAATWVVGSGAAALLFNCSRPEAMKGAVDAAVAVFKDQGVDVQIGVYANALEGETDDSAANEKLHSTRDDLNAEGYSRYACEWADAGASMIGCCCGIGASQIHALSSCLRATV